ncbi:50S ribosomal protein L35 [Candidatus Gracilibacteria bacterium]|nr:50S ribosomal protein L35 [Candidatus Gracilibacteria bacterium]
MKLKTHSGTKKRIKVTKKGKFMSEKPAKRHLLINKSKRQKQVSAMGREIKGPDHRKLARLLGRA